MTKFILVHRLDEGRVFLNPALIFIMELKNIEISGRMHKFTRIWDRAEPSSFTDIKELPDDIMKAISNLG